MPKPILAIVGRPNVGKSTLFNRIIGGRTAVVEAQPGVTRDRLQRDAEWAGSVFTLVDTGGIAVDAEDNMAARVTAQARQAIAEADVILFLLDGAAGPLPEDHDIAHLLRRSGKPVVIGINKVDRFDLPLPTADFYSLGLGEPIPISAREGLNIGDLLDEVISLMPAYESEEKTSQEPISVAVVGRPNVGKSSLVNAILGEERVIVSDTAGTTRDAIDTFIARGEHRYVYIDTAGIRRRSRVNERIERYSVLRAQKALARADVALLVLDAVDGVTAQDQRIAGLSEDAGKAMVIVVNKWDLVKKDARTMDQYVGDLRRELAFVTYAPIVFLSALTHQRIPTIFEAVDTAHGEYNHRVPTADLNRVLQDAVLATPPPAERGRRLKLYYATQVAVRPPTFVLFVNRPELATDAYRRYLENRLRRAWGFIGSPLRILWRRREAR